MNTAATTTVTAERARAVRARDVADLTVTSGYPCVSVLLPTEPSSRMTAPDIERLQQLVAEVDRELRDHGVPARERLMRNLGELVARAVGQPTDRSLAIYVNLAVARIFRLPVPVTARAVVERTFATRALLTALHRMPPHVVLVLHPGCAHLYQGADGRLQSVGHRDIRGAVQLPPHGYPGATEASQDMIDGFLRSVDRLLGDYRGQHPSPLVLCGSPHLVDQFCRLSRNLGRLAGRVPPAAEDTVLDLAQASGEVVERYLKSRRDEALDNLRQALASRPGDVARGMAACWQAVHHNAPGMLLVEEDYVSPGRPDDYGVSAPHPDQRVGTQAVHDLVDDLMEVVILCGGQLALVANGDLADCGRVALISRPANAFPAQTRSTEEPKLTTGER